MVPYIGRHRQNSSTGNDNLSDTTTTASNDEAYIARVRPTFRIVHLAYILTWNLLRSSFTIAVASKNLTFSIIARDLKRLVERCQICMCLQIHIALYVRMFHQLLLENGPTTLMAL